MWHTRFVPICTATSAPRPFGRDGFILVIETISEPGQTPSGMPIFSEDVGCAVAVPCVCETCRPDPACADPARTTEKIRADASPPSFKDKFGVFIWLSFFYSLLTQFIPPDLPLPLGLLCAILAQTSAGFATRRGQTANSFIKKRAIYPDDAGPRRRFVLTLAALQTEFLTPHMLLGFSAR